MAFIAPTQQIVTQVVPTTMPALGDLTSALSSIGAGILNYYNSSKTGSTTMTADMQAALLAQQQQDSNNTALMVGGVAVAAVALIWFKMRKKPKGGK